MKQRGSLPANSLSEELANKVMGWTTAPGRFLIGDRRWIPSWRFQPDHDLNDAFRLLAAAKADEFALTANQGRKLRCHVTIAGTRGEAEDFSPARAITLAIARALGIEGGQPR